MCISYAHNCTIFLSQYIDIIDIDIIEHLFVCNCSDSSAQ